MGPTRLNNIITLTTVRSNYRILRLCPLPDADGGRRNKVTDAFARMQTGDPESFVLAGSRSDDGLYSSQSAHWVSQHNPRYRRGFP
ncbi:hypothetical protein GCM10023063_04740 [Arthrobacter methylotrophus]